jgi:copper chaperone CopZ
MTEKIEFEIEGKTLALGAVSGLVATFWKTAPLFLPTRTSVFFTQNSMLLGLLGLTGLIFTLLQATEISNEGISIPKISAYSAAAGFLIFAVAGYSAAPISSALQPEYNEKLTGDNLRTTTLKVEGMVCQGCKMTVERYLESMDGTKRISVSLSNQEATVIYDPDITSAENLSNAKVFQGAYSATIMEDKKYQG